MSADAQSVHFSVYNPTNKRGFVSTACISLLQSRQFTCQQAKIVKDQLQQCSQRLQAICDRYWRVCLSDAVVCAD